MKKIGIIGAGIVALLALAVAVVPYLIPSEVYKAQVEKQAEAALGREVSLQGDARLSIIPRIAARIGGVTVANPAGFSAQNMIEAGELRARVKFWPLLSGRVEVAEISLVDANVSLERKADGSTNWDFSDGTKDEDTKPKGSASVNTGIDSARLVNSSVTYRDQVTGERYTLTEFTGRASMQALDQPLSFDGAGKFNDQSFDLSLDLSTIKSVISGEPAGVDMSLKTSFGAVSYDGSITFSDIPSLAGTFDFSSDQLDELTQLIGIVPGINLAAMGTIEAKGSVSGPADSLRLEIDRASQDADLMTASYSGAIDLGSNAPLDGIFSFSTKNAGAAVSTLNLNLPIELDPLGSLGIEGSVRGSFSAPRVTIKQIRQKSDLMVTDYSGQLSLADELIFDGALNTSIKDVGRVLTQLGMDTGPINILEELEFSGALNGPISSLRIRDSKLNHNGALFDLEFQGDAAVGGSGQFSGPISASSSDLRSLLEAMGIELAPGDTFQSFDLKGMLSGTSQNLSIGSLDFTIDDVSGTGSAGLDNTGPVPTLIADLNMPDLDLSPLLGSGSQDGKTRQQTGWNTDPLALDGLRAINTKIKLNAGQLKFGKVEVTNAILDAELSDGDLQTTISRLNAFGGNWNGNLHLDARQSTPRLTINMQGNNVAMQSVLSTFSNLETISGAGGLQISATSNGQSLDALVRGLNGEIKTDLSDGAIRGFNIAQIVRSLSSIRTGLASGSLKLALSPEAETDFTQFDAALTIKNGVANIDLMRAINPAVLLDGKGRIDIANQSIDISITPSIDTAGMGEVDMLKLNGEPFALPFRVSGNWLAPSVSIDNAAIAQQLQSRAVGEIGDRISDEIGGDLGNILGDALGRTSKEPDKGESEKTEDDQAPVQDDTSQEYDEQPASDDEPEPEPENLEDAVENAVEDIASDALKDLFGRKD